MGWYYATPISTAIIMNKDKIIKDLVLCVRRMALQDEIPYSDHDIAEYMYSSLKQLKTVSTFAVPVDKVIDITETTILVEDGTVAVTTTSKEDFSEFIEEMYRLYPAKCPKRNSSLGKSHKDKDRIKRLLKTYTKEEIEQVIRAEVDNNYGVNYMKNFSTFLNNFPEPTPTTGPDAKPYNTSSDETLVINGTVYK